MKQKINEKIKNKCILLLSKGLGEMAIAKELKISNKTVNLYKHQHWTDIEAIKKDNRDKILSTESEKYRQMVIDSLATAKRALAFITDEKLKLCSAAQLSMINAVLHDKYNIGVGSATDIIHHTHATANRQDILSEILGTGKKEPGKEAIPEQEAKEPIKTEITNITQEKEKQVL